MLVYNLSIARPVHDDRVGIRELAERKGVNLLVSSDGYLRVVDDGTGLRMSNGRSPDSDRLAEATRLGMKRAKHGVDAW